MIGKMLHMRVLVVLQFWAMFAVLSSHADFSRYQIILDRRPFGEASVEEVAEPVRPARPSGPSYADALRLVAMTISGGDVRVGLIDGNMRPPRTYFLFVGDEENGVLIVSANYESESVVVEKAGEQFTLRMGGGGAPTRGGSAGVGSLVSGVPNATEDAIRKRPLRVGRITEGRRQRMEEERRRMEMVPELTGAVLEKHLEEYNMQAIREGMPPLPIPLTPEQDAQLVREGVLPPMEE